jgi:hypothetical protein
VQCASNVLCCVCCQPGMYAGRGGHLHVGAVSQILAQSAQDMAITTSSGIVAITNHSYCWPVLACTL